MPNVFVEPIPKGRPEGSAIEGYILELAGRAKLVDAVYKTQAEAVATAKNKGHAPLIARVRNTNKGNPDHWRSA